MKYIYYFFLGLILIWVGGLFHFVYGLSQVEMPTDRKTDGIVVLTGGKNRLQEAVSLLEKGVGGKLFISGVNAKVTETELRAVLGSSKELADCCIESGTKAQNTVGNAQEVSLWVAKNHISSIRVVTSLEHMPRALVEMQHFMPGLTMIAHPVGQWRPENIRFMSLVREYSKYLVSLFRTNILDMRTE
ncbi:MAG: YdcF family protein [Emcibacter sp.]|nr:YdcF family protein [Emcibacter sp.]